MGQTILSGSTVSVAAAGHPRWGEIWAFCETPETVTVHRCVGRRGGRNRFWGDGNAEADALVDDALLVGRVFEIESPGGVVLRVVMPRELVRAAYVGARRLPRRLWYRGRSALRAALGRRAT